MTNSMVLVSIIVPVYNVEKYLASCLDSILQQTYENLQIILVDDGSIDSSLLVCKRYASLDTRIEVLCQDNYGASSARNSGIDHAKGDWIVFVDSDDTIMPEYVQNLLKAVYIHSCNMAISGICYWNEDLDEKYDKQFSYKVYRNDDFVKVLTEERLHCFGGPVSKIYNTRIIKENHVRFNTLMNYAEDCNFMLSYMNHVNSIALINCVDYVYRLHSGSLSSRKLNYFAECTCKDEMFKRFEELSIRFPFADLSELKASVLQYYGRVAKAILESTEQFTDKRNKLQSLSKEACIRFSKKDFRNYKAYCLYEKILLFFIGRPCTLSLLFFFDYVYRSLIKKRSAVL